MKCYGFDVDQYDWDMLPSGLYMITELFNIRFRDEHGRKHVYQISPGLVTDGGSIPSALSWFAPGWTDEDPEYNACFILHDCLYASELLPKKDADNVLRGSLRDCDVSRLVASTICFAVDKFATRHYGVKHDKYGARFHIEDVS